MTVQLGHPVKSRVCIWNRNNRCHALCSRFPESYVPYHDSMMAPASSRTFSVVIRWNSCPHFAVGGIESRSNEFLPILFV